MVAHQFRQLYAIASDILKDLEGIQESPCGDKLEDSGHIETQPSKD